MKKDIYIYIYIKYIWGVWVYVCVKLSHYAIPE